MFDELPLALKWADEGRKLALATVITAWGSAPRRIGSHLVIDEDGNFEGSVSGGCVEGAVITEALDVIESGNAQTLSFGVADEKAWEVGLSCGGKIEIYVEKVDLDYLKKLNQAIGQRQAVVTITQLSDQGPSGLDRVILEGDLIDGKLASAVEQCFLSGKSCALNDGNQDLFLNVYLPMPIIVVIGAVHISQALAKIAQVAGFEIRIIDPRTAFATKSRFENIDLIADWPQAAFEQKPIDKYCALVAVTHDPKIDDFALSAGLEQGCFYVGALGSRKTHASRLVRLEQLGLSTTALEKIHAPIGLDIGASNPQEIAVSIMAEIISSFRKRELIK